MKASELRIGNLITWVDEDDSSNAILTLTGIVLNDCIWVEWEWEDGAKDNTDCGLESIKGIPLTEEWLMKFGFKTKNLKQKRFEKEGVDLAGRLTQSGFEVYFIYKNLFAGETIAQYVHQLQNLYFVLTGEELEINQ